MFKSSRELSLNWSWIAASNVWSWIDSFKYQILALQNRKVVDEK